MIKFLVKGQNIETLEHEVIAADQIAFVKIHFVFDNNWKPMHKVVQFTQDEITYNRVLGTENTSCFLPAELTAGTVKMSLFGYDAEATALGHLPAQDAARSQRTPEPKIKNRRRRPVGGVSLLYSALTAPDRGYSDRW